MTGVVPNNQGHAVQAWRCKGVGRNTSRCLRNAVIEIPEYLRNGGCLHRWPKEGRLNTRNDAGKPKINYRNSSGKRHSYGNLIVSIADNDTLEKHQSPQL